MDHKGLFLEIEWMWVMDSWRLFLLYILGSLEAVRAVPRVSLHLHLLGGAEGHWWWLELEADACRPLMHGLARGPRGL